MIWLAIPLLAVITMAPLGWTAWRAERVRGRREAALGLHSAQLHELDRELGAERLSATEHQIAVLEVQRRLLAEAERAEAPTRRGGWAAISVTLGLVPCAALALYLVGGHPELPAQPLAARLAAGSTQSARDAELIEALKTSIASLDPHSTQARQGWVILGSAEASRGDMAGAANAWSRALSIQFDPQLAVQTAEAETEADGHISQQAAGLFRQALATAPADAAWRPMAERRLAESEKQQ